MNERKGTKHAAKKQEYRRFPSRLEMRAIEFGADELMNSIEWHYRDRPDDLRQFRGRYRRFCASFLRGIERACRRQDLAA